MWKFKCEQKIEIRISNRSSNALIMKEFGISSIFEEESSVWVLQARQMDFNKK
jgi:hypothetical protein